MININWRNGIIFIILQRIPKRSYFEFRKRGIYISKESVYSTLHAGLFEIWKIQLQTGMRLSRCLM